MSENMKPSGIAWIGDVPESWQVKQVAFMSDSRSGGTPDRNDMRFWEDGTISWMSSGEVNKVNVYETDEKITQLATRNSSAKIIKANSVMVALNGQGKTKGMSAVLRIDSACNQSLCAFSCYEGVLHYEYLFWCFQTMYIYLRQMSGDDIRDGLATSYVKKQKIPVASFREQTLIADFLDKQCEKIDSIATDIENQIEILRKYKKSLITEAVTKGLDKSVSMKDSGIEWIGDIPEHWKIKKIRYATTVRNETKQYFTGDIYIGLENVECSTGKLVETETEYEDGVCDIFFTNDVLFSKLRPYLEKAFVADFDGFCTGEFIIFKHFDGDNRFLFYFLISSGFIETVNASTYGTKMPRASWEYIKNLKIIIPNLQEQSRIAEYLDKQCTKIDSIIESKKEQLTKIIQHKKSLIYEYVTGKKQVKGAHSNGN